MFHCLRLPMTHAPETRAINRLHFLAPVFVPYVSEMKISGAKINVAVSYVNDE